MLKANHRASLVHMTCRCAPLRFWRVLLRVALENRTAEVEGAADFRPRTRVARDERQPHADKNHDRALSARRKHSIVVTIMTDVVQQCQLS